MSKKMLKRSLALGALMAFVITGSAMAADCIVNDGSTKSDQNTINVGADTFNNAGKVIANDSITVSGGIFKNTGEIQTGTLDIYGNNSDQGAIGGTINATEKFVYRGINGNKLERELTAVLDTPLLEIVGTNQQTGFKISSNDVLNNVDAINIESAGARTALSFAGSDLSVSAPVFLKTTNGTQDARLVILEGASVSFNNVTAKEGLSKIVINHSAKGSVDNLTVADNARFTFETWTDKTEQSGEFALRTVNVGDNSAVRAYIPDNAEGKSTSLTFTGSNVTFNLGTRAVADFGGMGNTSWRGDLVKLNAEKLTVNVVDSSSVVYISDVSEVETIEVVASAENNTGDAETDLKGLANVVKRTSETEGEEGSSIPNSYVAAGVEITQEASSIYDAASGTVAVDAQGNATVTKIATTKNSNVYGITENNALSLMAWRAEMNDMNKRMGELRNANGEHGVWVHMVRGEAEYESITNEYNQYQLGYDEKLSTDPSWTVGLALSYTDGESSYSSGSAENEHKGLSVYASKLNDDGSFIDLIAKYSRMENDFETTLGNGDYSTNGYSFSAEYGKRLQQGNGLWIEPQVELTYGKVGSADYKMGTIDVAQDSIDSLVGRLGFSLGKDIKQGNVYARASYLYDFDGETSVSFNDNGKPRTIEQDLGGGWWEVGVGANINLSKATYIYADVEKTFGGEVDTNWQWNLGVRYSF